MPYSSSTKAKERFRHRKKNRFRDVLSDRIDLSMTQVGNSRESQRSAGPGGWVPLSGPSQSTRSCPHTNEGVPDAPSLDLGPALSLGLFPFCRTPHSRKYGTPHLNQPEILPNRLNLGGLYSSSLMDRGNIFSARRRAGSTPL